MGELDTVLSVVSCENLHGRRKVFTDRRAVTDENVLEVLGKTLPIFQKNKAESKYLYDVYRGIQDIRHKEKMVRPEINNKITVNIANQIVAFDSAYFMNGPVQYVSSGEEKDVSDDIKRLNDFMRAEDKESRDKEIVDWQLICGQSIRMIIPAEKGDESGSPFKVYTLSPMEAYVIYHSGIGHKKLAGVIEQRDQDGNTYYCVYTKDKYYEIQDGKIITNLPRTLHVVPLVEYIDNLPRIGAFEIVLPMRNESDDGTDGPAGWPNDAGHGRRHDAAGYGTAYAALWRRYAHERKLPADDQSADAESGGPTEGRSAYQREKPGAVERDVPQPVQRARYRRGRVRPADGRDASEIKNTPRDTRRADRKRPTSKRTWII